MKRVLAYSMMLLALVAVGCGDDDNPANPSDTNTVVFTAPLLPANEVPPVTNAESSGSGTVTITMHLTRDAAQQITAATADFAIALNGFPAGTSVTAAHIHPGSVGQNNSPLVNLNLASGDFVLANGSGTFTKSVPVPGDQATQIINAPSTFYFNVHSSLNVGGFARGQLVKQ